MMTKQRFTCSGVSIGESPPSELLPGQKQHLISLQVKQLRPGAPGLASCSGAPHNTIHAYFSNMDVVFNASSWITLLNFFHKLLPQTSESNKQDDDTKPSGKKTSHSVDPQVKGVEAHVDLQLLNDRNQPETHASIEFCKINLLLLRQLTSPNGLCGQKVATIAMHGAKIHVSLNSLVAEADASLGDDLALKVAIQGSVAGLQMQDLCSWPSSCKVEGVTVLSLGAVPGEGETQRWLDENPAREEQEKAFSFVLNQGSVETGLNQGSVETGQQKRRPGQKGVSKLTSEPALIKRLDDDSLMDTRSGRCLPGSIFAIDDDVISGAGEVNYDVACLASCANLLKLKRVL